MILEIAGDMCLFFGGYFSTAEYEDVAVVRVMLGEATVSGGVVVGDADDVHSALQRQLDDVLGCHVQVAAGREEGVGVKVGFVDVQDSG